MGKFDNYLKTKKRNIDCILEKGIKDNGKRIDSICKPSNYSLISQSKRVRAIIILAVIEAFGKKSKKYERLAAAVEFLHTATLIHDDLPPVDNSNFRRGKLTNHKKFGEAVAILAGDYLFSYTFSWIIKEAERIKLSPKKIVLIINELIDSLNDVIKGQTEEIVSRGKKINKDIIFEILVNKTARLFQACFNIGGILVGVDKKKLKKLSGLGYYFGTAFQITDDIIDIFGTKEDTGKDTNLDTKNDVLTIPLKVGTENALKIVGTEIKNARRLLKVVKDSTTLNEILNFATYKRLEKYNLEIK